VQRITEILEPYLTLVTKGGMSPLLQERQAEMPLSALLAGYAAAHYARRLCPSGDAWQLAKLMGVRVEHQQAPEQISPGRRARSEYVAWPPTVVLYIGPMEELADVLFWRRPSLGEMDLPSVHLAHELFHHLMSHPPAQLLARLRRVPRRGEETAAHAFTHGFLNLRFFPAELDILCQRTRRPSSRDLP
jgi:hypothetical protein